MKYLYLILCFVPLVSSCVSKGSYERISRTKTKLSSWGEYFRLHHEITGTTANSLEEVANTVTNTLGNRDTSEDEYVNELQHITRDEWGNRIVFRYYQQDGQMWIELISIGRDGSSDTADDLYHVKSLSSTESVKAH